MPESVNARRNLAEIAQRLQAMAQTGLAFTEDRFDRERYEGLRRIAAELVGAPEMEEGFAAEWGYATPKVDVRAIVLREGRLLLVREAADGLWCPPGGWADVSETPARNAEREVAEETGLTVRATRLLGAFDRNLHGHPPRPFHAYKLFFLGESQGGDLRTAHDTLDVGFFDPADLPPLSLDRVVPFEIETCLRLAREGGPAYFD